MIKFNVELAVKLENDATTAQEAFLMTFKQMAALTPEMIDGMFAADYDMRQACRGDKRAINSVLRGVSHAAWQQFFGAHDAHHLLLDRERSVQHPYIFADSYKRSLYSDIKELRQFTAEEAGHFWKTHLSLTPERTTKWLNDLLDRTGKDYKNHCTAFKTKMSIRGLDSYSTVATELARAVYVMAHIVGIEYTFNELYTNLRNNRTIDGSQFAVCDGLDLTLEWHANGNTTIRLGKELVSQLNAALGA